MDWFEKKPVPTYRKAELTPKPQVPLPCMDLNEQIQNNMFYCPKPTDLFMENNIWQSNNGWKSFAVSFTQEITSFSGAQWQGFNVGRVICLYSGPNMNDFPVQISTGSLVHEPDKPLWTSNNSNATCVSASGNVCDCPFSFVKSQDTQSVDQIIDSFQ